VSARRNISSGAPWEPVTLVAVTRLVTPEMLVEVEADAYVRED
jgi:hypothetical protein